MANERMTSADVLEVNSSEEIVGVIVELSKKIPELAVFEASPVKDTDYYTLVETAEPSVAFRDVNEFREVKKATLTARQVSCKFLDAGWNIDGAAAKKCDWGVDAACAIQAKSHLRAALKHIASQTWYGVSADAKGFAGIASLHPNSDSDMTVDATGDTADSASSCFLVRFGLQDVAYAWGNDGRIEEGERIYTLIFDENGKQMWGYAQPIEGYVGLQITNYKATVRICNLTTQNGKGLTDDLIADALELFNSGEEPDAMFCSRRSLGQLRKSRTATNATGAPAPWPSEAFGIPIYDTAAVVDTEAILTPGT